MKFGGGTGRVQHGAFPGPGCGQFEEALPDPPKKIVPFTFQSVQSFTPLPDAITPFGGV